MIYQDSFGVWYKVRETLNSKLRGTGCPTYKVHRSISDGKSWLLDTYTPAFEKRWWRKAESGETFLKEYAEKKGWKPVNG